MPDLTTAGFRRFASASCLLLYLCAATPFLSACVAMAAVLEGGHEVRLAASRGGLGVILHHRAPEDVVPRCVHVHGAMTQALLAFAARPATDPSGHDDHVLNVDGSRSVRALRMASARDFAGAPGLFGLGAGAVFDVGAAAPRALIAGRREFRRAAWSIPPPVSLAVLVARSTVLLI